MSFQSFPSLLTLPICPTCRPFITWPDRPLCALVQWFPISSVIISTSGSVSCSLWRLFYLSGLFSPLPLSMSVILSWEPEVMYQVVRTEANRLFSEIFMFILQGVKLCLMCTRAVGVRPVHFLSCPVFFFSVFSSFIVFGFPWKLLFWRVHVLWSSRL